MSRLIAILRWIDSANEWTGRVVSFSAYGITAIMVVDVILRYAFSVSLIWAADWSLFLFGFLFLTGGYALLHRQHVGLDILSERWSKRTKAIVDIVTALFFFLWCGLMLWKGGEIALESIRVLETSRFSYGPPVYIVKTVIPIAALLILLQGLAKLIRDVIFAVTGKEIV